VLNVCCLRSERGVPGARGPKGEPGLSRRRRSPLGKLIANAIAPCRFIPVANQDRQFEFRDFFAQFLNEVEQSEQ
jgi:hypothetical protein